MSEIYDDGLLDNTVVMTPKKETYEPYVVESGWSNGDSTYSIGIKRLPLSSLDKPVKDWPQKTPLQKGGLA